MSQLIDRIDEALVSGATSGPKAMWRRSEVAQEMRRVATQIEETRLAVKRLSELAQAEETRVAKEYLRLAPKPKAALDAWLDTHEGADLDYRQELLAGIGDHYTELQAQLSEIQREVIVE